MLLKKEGWPEEDELVLCSVTGINPHSVFCTLDEYGGRTGMIHISEIASGRIRNIREYVQEGKKVVCKILQINKEKGHIDLSLRRVNEMQKRLKLNQIKQEQLAEKIIENLAKELNEKPLDLYKKIAEKTVEKYGSVFGAFELVSKGELDLAKVLDAKIAEPLTNAIQGRIKPPQVTIAGYMKLTSYSSDGLSEIKETLGFATAEGIEVRYLGAGTYHFEITTENYKIAEKALKQALDKIEKYTEKNNIAREWKRIES